MTNHNEIENILADQNKRTGPIGKPVKDLSHVPADTAINIPIHDPYDYTPVETKKTSIPIVPPI